MYNRLRKTYFILLAPAVAGFAAACLLRPFSASVALPEQGMAIVAPAVFILAAIFAVAGPVFYRAAFAHRQRGCTKVPLAALYRFERNLIAMALMTSYLALSGFVLQLPHFHLAATLLMALYGIYYYYPSQQRIAFDLKLFRTANGGLLTERQDDETPKPQPG